MKEVLSSPLFGIVLSIFAYEVGLYLNKKTGTPLCNPLLVAVALIIAVLQTFHIPLEYYQQGGDVIAIFLAPATASLALSVYGQIKQLQRHLLPVVAGCLVGSCASVGSVILLCRLFRLDEAVTAALLPKSCTTPIAVGIAESHGGIAAITMVAVLVTGFIGAVCAPLFAKLMHVTEPVAEGLAIGIIMDGNGRWAKNRGLPRTAGHKRGAEVFSDIADYCDELGVSSVYFYAFSTENWKRPLEEVNAIMRLFGEYLLKGFDYKNRNIRIKFMGDRTVLDEKLQQLMNKLEADSSVKTGMTLNIAINYGGRPEIVRAAQQLATKAAAGEIKPEEITEQLLSDAMYTAGQKDPDFILRPSGEKRLSNFMLWQAAYSELVEMDVLWPDFTRSDLDAAIEEFNHRSRRFGGL